MSFRPHLSVTKHEEKVELLLKFITLDTEAFLAYLFPLLSEAQWDRVQESELQSIIIYGHGGEGKTKVVEQIIGDVAADGDNLNLVLQQEKGGPFQVFTYGQPRDNKFVFVRLGEKEVMELEEQLATPLIVRFLPDPEK
jgi:hypothetical protein